jgi:hypothetical protein
MIGGGDQVLVSIALVMVADIFSEEERYTNLTISLIPLSDSKIDLRRSLGFNPVLF